MYTLKKIRDLAAAGALNCLRLTPHLGQSREDLQIEREKRLRRLLHYAIRHSPFYRRHLAGVDIQRVNISDLPILTKAVMMQNIDDLVTDRRLQLHGMNAHLNAMKHDDYYLGRYKIFRSGGSSGNPAVMAYTWREFSVVLAQVIRAAKKAVCIPLGRRMRGAVLYARTPTHDSVRISESFDVGIHRVLNVPADTPMADMIAQLNDFKPDVLSGYPSVVTELAHAQLDKRLVIKPQAIFLGSEPVTPAMRSTIRQAFALEPHDHYGTTEAIVMASECPLHHGMHLNDDIHWIEIVDENNKPVKPGQTGHKVLVTNLYAFTQPIIRYELSDMLQLHEDQTTPCPCGNHMRLIRRVIGRNEDLVRLPGRSGEVIVAHEDLRTAMAPIENLRQFQILQHGDRIEVKAVVKDRAHAESTRRQIVEHLEELFARLKADAKNITALVVEEMERNPRASQKFRQISISSS